MGTSTSGAEFAGKIQQWAVQVGKMPRDLSYSNAKLGKEVMENAVRSMAPAGVLRGMGKKGAKVGARYNVYGDGNVQISMRGPVWIVENDTAGHTITPKKMAKSRAKSARSTLAGERYDHPYRGSVEHPGTTGKHVWSRAHDDVLQPLLRENISRDMRRTMLKAFG